MPRPDAEMEFPSAKAAKKYCQKKSEKKKFLGRKNVPIESNKMERTKNLPN